MLAGCVDPSGLTGMAWFACYLTTGKHMAFYMSFGTVLLLLAVTAPAALLFGFGGALASRSAIAPLRWLGRGYIAMVRGIPEIIFFLFVPLAIDQGFEYLRHKVICPDWSEPVRQGNDFVVCTAAKLPLNADPQWMHEIYGFMLAVLAFAIVFGAFAANTIRGAFDAVPKAQVETAQAFGMNRRQVFWRVHMPQMWVYALPGLSNLWMILTKATPLLFLHAFPQEHKSHSSLFWFGLSVNIFAGNVVAITQQSLWGRVLNYVEEGGGRNANYRAIIGGAYRKEGLSAFFTPPKWFARVLMNAPIQGTLPWFYNDVLPLGEPAALKLAGRAYASVSS